MLYRETLLELSEPKSGLEFPQFRSYWFECTTGVKKKELEVWNHVCWNSWWIIQSQSVYQSTIIFVRQNDGKNTLSKESHVKKKLVNLLNFSSKCFTRVRHIQNRSLRTPVWGLAMSLRALLLTWKLLQSQTITSHCSAVKWKKIHFKFK